MIDSHCRIAGPEFVDDLGAVDRAQAAGLRHSLVILAQRTTVARVGACGGGGDGLACCPVLWATIRMRPASPPMIGAAREVAATMDAQPARHRGLGEIGLDPLQLWPRDVRRQIVRERLGLAVTRRLRMRDSYA